MDTLKVEFIKYGMSTLELSSYVLEIPNDAYWDA